MVPDAWYTSTNFKGAFGTSNWLDGWSFMNLPTEAGFVSGAVSCPADTSTDPIAVCGDITTDTVWVAGPLYVMSCQTFVRAGATLSIQAGATIYAAPVDPNGLAPALVVETGGMLIADGAESAPITFTALNPEQVSSTSATTDTGATDSSTVLETRGKWGGLILLGSAPTSAASPKEIEGITGMTYGGTDPSDSSGTLSYVRVWHGGAVIGADNEINGITFGGVGSGTTVEYCEVAYNLDDGFEFAPLRRTRDCL